MSHVQYMLVGNRQRIQASDRRKRKLTRQRIDGKKGSTWIILGTYIWTSHQRNPLNHSVQHSTSEGSVQTPHVQLRAIRKHGIKRQCRRMKVDLKLFGFLLEQFVASEIGSVLKTAKKQSTMCSHLDFLWWLTHSLITTMTQVNTLCILVMFLYETYVSVYVSKKNKKNKRL